MIDTCQHNHAHYVAGFCPVLSCVASTDGLYLLVPGRIQCCYVDKITYKRTRFQKAASTSHWRWVLVPVDDDENKYNCSCEKE